MPFGEVHPVDSVHPVAQLIDRWTPGVTPVGVGPALDIPLPVGMAGGLWQGPPEGQVKPVSAMYRVQ